MDQSIIIAYSNTALRGQLGHFFDCLQHSFFVHFSDSFASAEATLASEAFDLCLAVSDDLRAAIVFHTARRHIPIVWILPPEIGTKNNACFALSGSLDCWSADELSELLVQQGAALLLEREKLRALYSQPVLPEEHQELHKEIKALLDWYYRTRVTAEIIPAVKLKELMPEKFAQIGAVVSNLIDQALEERTFKVAPKTSTRLSDISHELGLLNAGPSDVVDLFADILRAKAHTFGLSKGRAYVEASRLLLLELMGYMLTHYRNLAHLASRHYEQ